MEKKFKCEDKIIYRLKSLKNTWRYNVVSHYYEDSLYLLGSIININHYDILPFKGYEHLVGTTNSPKEEITLEKEESIVCFDCLNHLKKEDLYLGKFNAIQGLYIHTTTNRLFVYCIPFNKFIPGAYAHNVKETLTIKDGKLIKIE